MSPRSRTLAKASRLLLNRAETRLGCRQLRSLPSSVDVVLTKACNLACSFCRDYEHEGSKKLSKENMERIAAQLFPAAGWVNICSGGEPYLHPGLEHILRLAKAHDAKTWVLSNAMLLQEARLWSIVEENLINLHGFSVDGLKPKTVEAIRVHSGLGTILKNIDMLFDLRRRAEQAEPGIVIRYALMRRNIEELPEAMRYWGERGATRLDCGYLVLANGIEREESLFFHQDLMQRIFDEAREVASHFPETELRLPPSVLEDQAKAHKPVSCKAPWDFVMVDTSGTILPCYRSFEALQMGNILEPDAPTFEELWNSPAYQALRNTVNQSGPKVEGGYGYCRVCENRYGWSSLDVHLGDETWIKQAFGDGEAGLGIDHRRKGFREMPAVPPADSPSGETETN